MSEWEKLGRDLSPYLLKNDWRKRLARTLVEDVCMDMGNPISEYGDMGHVKCLNTAKTISRGFLEKGNVGHVLAEVTYNGDRNEVYVDIYREEYTDTVSLGEIVTDLSEYGHNPFQDFGDSLFDVVVHYGIAEALRGKGNAADVFMIWEFPPCFDGSTCGIYGIFDTNRTFHMVEVCDDSGIYSCHFYRKTAHVVYREEDIPALRNVYVKDNEN